MVENILSSPLKERHDHVLHIFPGVKLATDCDCEPK